MTIRKRTNMIIQYNKMQLQNYNTFSVFRSTCEYTRAVVLNLCVPGASSVIIKGTTFAVETKNKIVIYFSHKYHIPL